MEGNKKERNRDPNVMYVCPSVRLYVPVFADRLVRFICSSIFLCACIYQSIYCLIYIYICMYVCMYIYMYVCMYVSISLILKICDCDCDCDCTHTLRPTGCLRMYRNDVLPRYEEVAVELLVL